MQIKKALFMSALTLLVCNLHSNHYIVGFNDSSPNHWINLFVGSQNE